MSKAEWQRHRDEVLRNALADTSDSASCVRILRGHRNAGCAACAARGRTIKANKGRQARHAALTSCGLVRVVGALGGVYYE